MSDTCVGAQAVIRDDIPVWHLKIKSVDIHEVGSLFAYRWTQSILGDFHFQVKILLQESGGELSA